MTENHQASTSRDKHRRQFPGCRRSQTNHCGQRLDGDGLRSRGLPEWSVHSDGWTALEAGTGTWTILSDSLRDASKTLLYAEVAPTEVSLIPVAETEALLPAEQDRKRHQPDLPIELKDPTDDNVTQLEALQPPVRNWCHISISARGPDDPHSRGDEAERSDPQLQLDFKTVTSNLPSPSWCWWIAFLAECLTR